MPCLQPSTSRRTPLATHIKTYAGGFTYLDTDGTGPSGEALDHFGLSGGRVKVKDGGFAYQYRHADHLGNTRVLYEIDADTTKPGKIVQALAYYPYGRADRRPARPGGSSNVDQ